MPRETHMYTHMHDLVPRRVLCVSLSFPEMPSVVAALWVLLSSLELESVSIIYLKSYSAERCAKELRHQRSEDGPTHCTGNN